jgi:hypothetical protein
MTAAAAALMLALRLLPKGPQLTHMDFISGGPGALEFCDLQNPKFLPVRTRSSPVTMSLDSAMPLTAGGTEEVTLALGTVTGKPIGPGDLVPTGAERINLLAVDPDLEDFQVFPPVPGDRPGRWRFAFTPRRTGVYRIFADFTPAATGREMYASADLEVGPGVGAFGNAPTGREPSWTADREGYRFSLTPAAIPIRAREPAELKFNVESPDGGPALLQPIDGGLASLVAFDRDRTGFVNLRARAAGGAASAPGRPPLVFSVAIPDPGRYVVWSRVSLGGREIDAPFRFEVVP